MISRKNCQSVNFEHKQLKIREIQTDRYYDRLTDYCARRGKNCARCGGKYARCGGKYAWGNQWFLIEEPSVSNGETSGFLRRNHWFVNEDHS